MTWLLENPFPALIIGMLLAAMAGTGWLRTGRQWLLYATIAILLLTAGAVVLERLVVTDREQVDRTLHEIARLVERNDIQAALQYAHSESPAVRAQAAGELSLYTFHEVRICRNLEIEVFPKNRPPRATARCNVNVLFSTRNGLWANQRVLRFVEVTLYKEDDGQWRVASYAHDDPMQGLRNEGARNPSGRQPWQPPR